VARNGHLGKAFAAGLLAIGAIAGQAPPRFEVASVKLSPPGGNRLTSISPPGAGTFTATNVSLAILIAMAFGLDSDRVSGPGWVDSEQYDVSAKPEGGVL
jgi:uncharacterized protein (TIGR03435 family)